MAQYVVYRRKSVSAESINVTLKRAESVMAVNDEESTVNVSVYWRILEL